MVHNEELDGFQSSEQFLKRERSVLGELSAKQQDDAAHDLKKRRKSVGRRVSFAPDAQLETRHLYSKDKTPEQNRNPQSAELQNFAGAAFQPNMWQRLMPAPSPLVTGSGYVNESPVGGSTMELTSSATADYSSQQGNFGMLPQEQLGEVTAGVPSLAELAQSDGDTDQYVRMGPYTSQHITDAVPSLSTLLEEDEADLRSSTAGGMTGQTDPTIGSKDFAAPDQAQEVSMDLTDAGPPADTTVQSSAAFSIGGYTNVLEAGQHPQWGAMADKTASLEVTQTVQQEKSQQETPEPATETLPEQVDTWGCVPGADDTQDLNLASQGRLQMGENTFNQIYGNNDTTIDISQHQLAEQSAAQGSASPADELLRRADDTLDSLRSAMKCDSPGGSRRRSSFGLGSGRSSMRGRASDIFDAGSTPRRQLGRPSSGFQDTIPPLARLSDLFSDGSPVPGSPALYAQTRVGHLSGDSALRGLQPGSAAGPAGMPGSTQGLRNFQGAASQPGSGDDPWSAAAKSARRASVASLSLQAAGQDTSGGAAFEDAAMPVRRVGATFEGMLLSGQKDRRISAGNTGRLLEDYTMGSPLIPSQAAVPHGAAHGDLPLPSATPGLRAAGKDMTTGLLLEDSILGDITPSVRKATMLQIHPGQIGNMVQLRAFSGTAASGPMPGPQGILKTPATTRLLADSRTLPPLVPVVVPQASQVASSPADFSMDLSLDLGAGSPNLLRDQTMDGFDVPSEPGWEQLYQPAPAPAPTPSVFAGGPLLQRTPPVSVGQRQSLPTHAEATPEPVLSRARSQRLDSPARGSAAHPSPNAPAGQEIVILGGVKLARTPTRASSRLAVQSPAQAQSAAGATPKPPLHPRTSESTGVVTRSAARAAGMTPPPSTVSRLRGPSVARTPIGAVQHPVAITLQDFLKEVDIQFLDHMRRGASINLADLASDPPPATLQECYKLMCITAPEVAQYETSIATLESETAARKAAAKEKEAELAVSNPAIFQQIQMASKEDHEAIKHGSQTLKKLCRLRTTVAWKEWRASMEAARGSSLQSHLQLLQHDYNFLQNNLNHLKALDKKVEEYGAEAKAAAALAAEQHAQETERRRNLLALRNSLADLQIANRERERKTAESAETLMALKAKHAVTCSKREQMQKELAELQVWKQAQPQRPASASAGGVAPRDVMDKIEQLDILQGCLGWRVESTEANTTVPGRPVVLVKLNFGKLFRAEFTFHKNEETKDSTFDGVLLLLPEEETPGVPSSHRRLAAHLVGDPAARAMYNGDPSVMLHFSTERATSARVTSTIFDINRHVGRVKDLLTELNGLFLRFPKLVDVSVGAAGELQLRFLDMGLEILFSVTLSLGPEYWEGCIPCKSQVLLAGPTSLTPMAVNAAVAAMPPCNGRLHKICNALSLLAADPGLSAPQAACDSFAQDVQGEQCALSSQDAGVPAPAEATEVTTKPEPPAPDSEPAPSSEPVPASEAASVSEPAIVSEPAAAVAEDSMQDRADAEGPTVGEARLATAKEKQATDAAAEQAASMEVDADAAAAEAALQVFSNPLFNTATPARPSGV